MNQNRDNFSNRFGVLVAVAGSAVGLGNVWRFPYLVGENGGGAFILVYLLFTLICIPIMISEFIIGRKGRANAVGAMKKLAPKSAWNAIGIISVLSSVLILSFYSVIGGWTIEFIIESAKGSYLNLNASELTNNFAIFTSKPLRPVILSLIFLLITAIIVSAGVKKGIEKYSKILMPILFVLIVVLAIKSITLNNASEGLKFLFKPDFKSLSAKGVLAAMGQAFFSLSLGMGCIITYGSYVKDDENITKMSVMSSFADLLFALIAAIAVIPAVFAFGISPGQGPSLVFITLPQVFAQMPLGRLVGFAFFFILLIAALTSSISLLEVFVAWISEEMNITRKKAVFFASLILSVLVVLCSLSQGVLKDFLIFNKTFFDLFDHTTADILLPLGGLLIVLFTGYKLKRNVIVSELTNNGMLKVNNKLIESIIFIIKYLAPLAIIIIFISGWLS
jgi:NSS family neurotransmitter:Na+ symporter